MAPASIQTEFRPHRRLAEWRSALSVGASHGPNAEQAPFMCDPFLNSIEGSTEQAGPLDINDLPPLTVDLLLMNTSPRYLSESPSHDDLQVASYLPGYIHGIDPSSTIENDLQELVFGEGLPSATDPPQLPQELEPLNNKQCRCKRSKCLKLYCECFAANVFCHGCKCTDCHNDIEHLGGTRRKAVEQTLERHPEAFDGKIRHASIGGLAARQGCHCKRSSCRKKYCECFQNGVACSDQCKCTRCLNVPANIPGSNTTVDAPAAGGFGCFQLPHDSGRNVVLGGALGQMSVLTPRTLRATSIEELVHEMSKVQLPPTNSTAASPPRPHIFTESERVTPIQSGLDLDGIFTRTPTSGTIVKKRRVSDDLIAELEADDCGPPAKGNSAHLEQRMSTQDENALEVLASFMQKWQ